MERDEAQVIRVARALGDPTRYRLLRAIAARGQLSCAELTRRFPVSQATVSHHLKVLSDAGLLAVEKRGQFHIYRLVPDALGDHGRLLGRAFAPRRRAARERSP
ncbi:MAG TPA: metalloregulator ArsR/SmtB family transcription factor [Anaeromyxobacteraceae bacterium]|nr:metalloregulator ArsR/SmtB family transcription factor [Anaeromyxobacteraceae bacterium]